MAKALYLKNWRRRIGIEPTWDFVEPHTGFEDHDIHQTCKRLHINALRLESTPFSESPSNSLVTVLIVNRGLFCENFFTLKNPNLPNVIKISKNLYRLDLRRNVFDSVRQIVNGGKDTLKFSHKVDADKKAIEIQKLFDKHGSQKLESFENVLRMDPKVMLDRLTPYGKTIQDAVDFYVNHLKEQHEIQKTQTLGILMDEWIKEKKRMLDQNTLRPDTYDTLFCKANGKDGYKNQWGNRPVASITSKEINDWIEDRKVWFSETDYTEAAQTSKLHQLSYLSQFFMWCKKNHKVPRENPCDSISIKRDAKSGKVEYFDPEEAREIMNLSMNAHFISILPYNAICMFSGVRVAECKRLTWDSIDFDDKSIVIIKTDSKTNHGRRVAMQPNLVSWLKWFRDKHPQYPLILKIGLQDKTRRFRKQVKVWHKNGLRHSAASYTLGAKLGDYAYLEQHFGNSRSMLEQHYLNYPAKEESLKFWAIVPPTSETSELSCTPLVGPKSVKVKL